MNDEKVINHMIAFIEDKEKEFVADHFSDATKKSVVISAIIKELEQEFEDEN